MARPTQTLLALLKRIAQLEKLNTGLQAKVAEQAAVIAQQSVQIAALLAENTELKRRLGLNSRNSSRPPSSEGLSKPPRTHSLRERGEKKSGGQRGHKGETLQQSQTPDVIERHVLTECPGCLSSLEGVAPVAIARRQVFDIPAPRVMCTEHQSEVKVCPCCGEKSAATFPSDVLAPVPYGAVIKSWAVYLQHQHFIPEDCLQTLFSDWLGVAPATATLNGSSQIVYERLADFENEVLEQLKTAPVKHLDETGFRIGGKTQWLHVLSSLVLTYFHVAPT